jgi:hypothetical protein
MAVMAVMVEVARATSTTASNPPASLVDRLQWTRGRRVLPVATLLSLVLLPLLLPLVLLLLVLLPLPLPLLPLLVSRSLLRCRSV